MKYIVHMKSVPGFCAQYEGTVDVYLDDGADWETIYFAACDKLKRTSFPDRWNSDWVMVGYEVAA